MPKKVYENCSHWLVWDAFEEHGIKSEDSDERRVEKALNNPDIPHFTSHLGLKFKRNKNGGFRVFDVRK